jgi:hypothetical protein
VAVGYRDHGRPYSTNRFEQRQKTVEPFSPPLRREEMFRKHAGAEQWECAPCGSVPGYDVELYLLNKAKLVQRWHLPAQDPAKHGASASHFS